MYSWPNYAHLVHITEGIQSGYVIIIRDTLLILSKFGKRPAESGQLEAVRSQLLSQNKPFHPAVQMHLIPAALSFGKQVAPFLQGESVHA